MMEIYILLALTGSTSIGNDIKATRVGVGLNKYDLAD